jgi:hypothetical protein
MLLVSFLYQNLSMVDYVYYTTDQATNRTSARIKNKKINLGENFSPTLAGYSAKKIAVAFAGNDSVPPLRKKRHASLQHQATANNMKITCSRRKCKLP